MLAGEFPGHLIQAAHALDRHQERLVPAQTRVFEVSDLVAQMALQLIDISRADRPMPLHITPPLPDLRLQASIGGPGYGCHRVGSATMAKAGRIAAAASAHTVSERR